MAPVLIPRIIHQTAPSASLTPEVRANIARIRELHPGWDYRFYDDAAVQAFVQGFGPRVRAAFGRIDPRYGAARADLFRYLLMHRFGGVYLDIKSTIVKCLDEVLLPDDAYCLAHWPNRPGERFPGWGLHPEVAATGRGEFQQWHIIARPEHPFLRNVVAHVLRHIERYDPALHGVGRLVVLRTTGPIAYTRAILPLLADHPHRLFDTHGELGLRYSLYGQENGIHHRKLFKTHYATLREPLVMPEGA